MATQFEALSKEHQDFIAQQHLYFVGTAGAEGFVNVSPKGMDSFRIVDSSRVLWLNLTGSGNESAAHVLENRRMTIMFCSFTKQPLILRIYGEATVIHPRDPQWDKSIALFSEFTGARQIFDMSVTMVQTSCGFAVPYFEFTRDRSALTKWADNEGREGIKGYWLTKNTLSLNGKSTGIVESE